MSLLTDWCTVGDLRCSWPDPQKTMPSAIAGPLATDPPDAKDHKILPIERFSGRIESVANDPEAVIG